MIYAVLYSALVAAQAFTTGIYIRAYTIPGSQKPVKKMTCSTIFVLAGVVGIIYNGGFSPYSAAVLAGLVLSWLGDLFLAYGLQGKMFVLGLSSFLLGHVAYIAAFVLATTGLAPDAPFLNVYEIIMILVLMAVVFIVKFACKIRFDGMGVPVFVYAVVICLMLTKAVSLSVRAMMSAMFNAPLTFFVLTLGAANFVASDAVLVFILFKNFKGVKSEAANLITYYGAQMLLSLSVFLLG